MIIRWVCETCNKRWIYPIEKCIYCKGVITKQKGTKLKVIGITKVNIPSPMHPIVPYNVLLLQDEHGNRLPKKTMNDYNIGEDYIEKIAKTNDAVAIVKVKYDIYEAIKEAIGLLKGFEFDSKDKILIKPSIVTAAYSYQAVNTNPDFIDALIRVLFDFGIKKENIIVAEQALIGSDSKDAASKAGNLDICKKYGIEFMDISKGPFKEMEIDDYKFNVFKEALNRKIINCPIMKSNFQLGISGAVENLSRLVDEQTQRNMYFDDITITLPKLVKSLENIFTIADATNGMQAQGPLALGEPAFLNLVLAGKNIYNLDTTFSEITMLPLTRWIGIPAIEKKNLEVIGNSMESLKYPLKQANPNDNGHPDIKIIDGKACPACLNIMNNITTRLVGLRGDEITIAIGAHIKESELSNKDRLVILGDCAIKSLAKTNIASAAKIDEKTDSVEQVLLMKKLLTTKGTPKITPVDKVKSKMKKLLSKVM